MLEEGEEEDTIVIQMEVNVPALGSKDESEALAEVLQKTAASSSGSGGGGAAARSSSSGSTTRTRKRNEKGEDMMAIQKQIRVPTKTFLVGRRDAPPPSFIFPHRPSVGTWLHTTARSSGTLRGEDEAERNTFLLLAMD